MNFLWGWEVLIRLYLEQQIKKAPPPGCSLFNVHAKARTTHLKLQNLSCRTTSRRTVLPPPPLTFTNAAGQTGDVQHHFFGALLPDRDMYVPAGKIVDADFHPCPFSFHRQAFYNDLKKILRNGQKAKNPNVYTINSFKKMEI